MTVDPVAAKTAAAAARCAGVGCGADWPAARVDGWAELVRELADFLDGVSEEIDGAGDATRREINALTICVDALTSEVTRLRCELGRVTVERDSWVAQAREARASFVGVRARLGKLLVDYLDLQARTGGEPATSDALDEERRRAVACGLAAAREEPSLLPGSYWSRAAMTARRAALEAALNERIGPPHLRALAMALTEGPDGEDWNVGLRLAERVIADLAEDGWELAPAGSTEIARLARLAACPDTEDRAVLELGDGRADTDGEDRDGR